jgi:hypothetical protein
MDRLKISLIKKYLPGMRQVFVGQMAGLYNNDVFSLKALLALLYGKFYTLAFFESAEAIALNCREMHEYICSVFLGEETITFATVEPFYGPDHSCRHNLFYLLTKN